MKPRIKLFVIAAGMAALASAASTPSAFAGPDDVYWWCWKQADYVRPALDPRGKEGWVANCVADHSPPLTWNKKKKKKKNY